MLNPTIRFNQRYIMKQFSKELGKVSITPKGAWDSNIANERLDVVYDRRNNQAYIAKQNVPVGVDIDNREYWQPLNVSGYADNNFINLCRVNESGNLIAYDNLQEAISSIEDIGRKPGAVLSFYNINKDHEDNNYQFELWQFNSADITDWEDIHKWRNIYYVDEQLNDLSNRCTQIENTIKNIQIIPETKIEQLF